MEQEEVTLVSKNVTDTHKEKVAAHKRHTNQTRNLMALLGTLGVLLWITFFSMGMLINSKTYRDPLQQHFNVGDFIMTVLTYTPTNIAILCIVASFTGGCASLLVISKAEKVLGLDEQGDSGKTTSHIYMSESPFSSMLRGIVVFFAFLAGVVVTSSNAFIDPSPQAYTQAAGVVSMLAFVVGYDPTLFRSFISVADKLKRGDN